MLQGWPQFWPLIEEFSAQITCNCQNLVFILIIATYIFKPLYYYFLTHIIVGETRDQLYKRIDAEQRGLHSSGLFNNAILILNIPCTMRSADQYLLFTNSILRRKSWSEIYFVGNLLLFSVRPLKCPIIFGGARDLYLYMSILTNLVRSNIVVVTTNQWK